MLASSKRISRRDFKKILENKGIFVVYNKLGTLKYLPSQSIMFAVVTSSKHERSAVVRNKVRRRIYSLVQELKPSIQGVFYVAKSSYQLSFQETKDLIIDVFTKAQKRTQ